jgi:hypothetical protein
LRSRPSQHTIRTSIFSFFTQYSVKIHKANTDFATSPLGL